MFEALTKLREERPLVHNMTNVVVTNFTANGLLALGASPVMANAIEEVADMAKIAGAVVLNIGTLSTEQVEAMIIAGKSANEHGVPVILDPVGAGATEYRTTMAQKILREVDVSILRGNAPEIANVVGEAWDIKGVDAGEDGGDTVTLAKNASIRLNCTVVITGKVDVVAGRDGTYLIKNGHSLLTKVTGAGCLLSSVIGAFVAVEKNHKKAATTALAAYGVAAENAAQLTSDEGPGSFQVEFLNQLANITEKDSKSALIEKHQG